MASRIKAADIEHVKAQTNIADVVADHVALKSAGIDSMKGLCPFHDERSPSFHVRPNLGYYHCFGCGESGDAIKFLQQTDHLSFVEAVERLAAKIGYELSYEDGPRQESRGPSKTRLYEANMAAQQFYHQQLFTEQGSAAKELLNRRGFDDSSLKHFGIGFSPDSWDALRQHLRQLGFSEDETIQAGLLAKGDRNAYDRFRGRLMWPIRDASGQILGFGARKLSDDKDGPKYLNTPETSVYHKSKVLYGIDLAKRAIATNKRVVVVEGYTDVMACHLAGITEAVATCGTAFGKDHISLLRRMMGDDPSAQVIFTFDPDEAGQNAALKAFANEHMFRAQTYVAVADEGMDPSDLRQHRGDAALQSLFQNIKPLFVFALQESIKDYDLNSVEGRVSALRSAAPIVASIKDKSVQPGYIRELANMLGVDEGEVRAAVRGAQTGSTHEVIHTPIRQTVNRNSPGYRLEYDAIRVMLQLPGEIGQDLLEQAVTAQINDPDLRVLRDAMATQMQRGVTEQWIAQVLEALPAGYDVLLHELAVSPVPQHNPKQMQAYAVGVVVALLERDLLALKTELIARLQRIQDPAGEEFRQTQQQILMLEQARRTLRELVGSG